MGVTLGTLTTKDGQVIPLPTALDVIEELNADEYHREEARRYSKCVHSPITHGVWDTGVKEIPLGPVRWSEYKVKTENLKRKGEVTMGKPVDYTSVKFRIFEYLFKHPKEWVRTRDIATALQTSVGNTSATITPIRTFLGGAGLLNERDASGTANGREIMFIGEADKPEEEARLWYAKMLARKGARGKKSTIPAPVCTPLSQSPVQPVQVDTQTMEAIIRVPLAKLPDVLRLLAG